MSLKEDYLQIYNNREREREKKQNKKTSNK